MHILNTLAPVFLIIGLGAALRRFGFIGADMHRQLNRLAYWVATPCLLFIKIGTAPPAAGSAGRVAQAVLLTTLLLALLALVGALVMRQPARSTGALIHAGFRGNLAFVGLPVIIFAFSDHPDAARAEAATALSLGPIIVGYNVLAVLVLLLARHRFSGAALLKVARGIVTNPLIISCLAGLAWNRFMHVHDRAVPVMLDRVLSTLGNSALPLALTSVGASLVSTPLRGRIGPATMASAIKVAAGPVVGWTVATACGGDHVEVLVATLLAACPSAIVSYVLTDQLDGDAGLCATAIVISTLMSAVGLAAVLRLVG